MKVCAQCKHYKGGGDWGLCCSICNAYCREERVFDTCPCCGNEITGAIWGTQKHYRGTK